MSRRLVPWLVALASLFGCGGDGAAVLRVDLRTDCSPSTDFDTIELLVTRAATGDVLVERTLPATPESYIDGRRIAELDELPNGELRIRLRLRLGDALVMERSVVATLSGSTPPLTVVITCGVPADMGVGEDMGCVEDTCCDLDGDGEDSLDCGGSDCDDSNEDISSEATETVNRVDDDCDGVVDEGFDCLGSGTELCSDGCDNDGDGFVDCNDDECTSDAVCGGGSCDGDPEPERSVAACSDGCDNDANGFTDCADFACDGLGGCEGCGCGAGEECLQRQVYGFNRICGAPCIVGSDAGAGPPTWYASNGGCAAGNTCWWRGIDGDPSGVCAPTAMVGAGQPVGSRCITDADCDSPYGFGRCLREPDNGFTDGYCTIQDCGAPGTPPIGTLCGDGSACLAAGTTSYCFDQCMDDSECRAGYSCFPVDGAGNSFCLPECASGGDCGTFGNCSSTADGDYCVPAFGF